MRIFVGYLASPVRWLAIGIWTALCISAALSVVAITRNRERALQMARTWWAPGVLRFAGARLETCTGPSPSPGRPWLFASNHSSMVDIPALFAALPVAPRFIAKRELRRVPLLGWYMAAVGMVLIDRKHRRKGAQGTHQAARVLADGGSLLAFPEGTRSIGGSLQPFKSGAFAAAIATGTPVVPVAMAGTREILAPGSSVLHPGRYRVVLGEPIPTEGLTPDDRRELAARAEAAVAGLLRRLKEAGPT